MPGSLFSGRLLMVAGIVGLCCIASKAQAAYVTPKMGGGQQSAPMVMPNVLFDGSGLTITGVLDMMGMPIMDLPVLRPLTGTDMFNPATPAGVLNGKAYNMQYGWNLDAMSENFPSGANLWIDQTSSTPGLMTYEHGTYTPIFGTDGSNSKWLWDGIMAHNAYAVDPGIDSWTATYHLYLGDSQGNPLNGYSDATITLNWTSVPEPASIGLLMTAGLLMLRRRQTSAGTAYEG